MKFLFFFLCLTIISLCSAAVKNDQKVDPKKGKAPWITLNDGKKMPSFGLGTSPGFGNKDTKAEKSVEEAIKAGYRLFDTAEVYGNEDQIGKAIKKKIEDGTITRRDVYVVTKLGNTHMAKDVVVSTLRESLKRMKLDFVDLYLIHWPVAEKADHSATENIDYLDTWKGMEECKKLGLTRSIGVSNFNEKQLERLIKNAKVKPAVLEIEVNPTLTQTKLVKFSKDNQIAVIGFAPLGSIPEAKKKPTSPPPSLDDPILTEIAKKYKKNTVQVVLRYLVDRGVVPIPKSNTPSRIEENINVFDFKLTADEIKKIDGFNKDFRHIQVPEWKSNPYYPF